MILMGMFEITCGIVRHDIVLVQGYMRHLVYCLYRIYLIGQKK